LSGLGEDVCKSTEKLAYTQSRRSRRAVVVDTDRLTLTPTVESLFSSSSTGDTFETLLLPTFVEEEERVPGADILKESMMSSMADKGDGMGNGDEVSQYSEIYLSRVC
jgi:hypothetical protein